jgi:hypothetical protein
LAHLVPPAFLPEGLAGTSVFVLTDYGRIWNQDFPSEPTGRAASFAAGVKILVIGKFSLELGGRPPSLNQNLCRMMSIGALFYRHRVIFEPSTCTWEHIETGRSDQVMGAGVWPE